MYQYVWTTVSLDVPTANVPIQKMRLMGCKDADRWASISSHGMGHSLAVTANLIVTPTVTQV